MRKRNNVKQLGRTHAHRQAMLRNMATSLFEHERIVSTKVKIKTLQRLSEKLITRAKMIYKAQTDAEKLHHKREIFKVIKDRDIAAKLFDDIAQRNIERPGGYTRIVKMPRRQNDASEIAMIELVEFREKVLKKSRNELTKKNVSNKEKK